MFSYSTLKYPEIDWWQRPIVFLIGVDKVWGSATLSAPNTRVYSALIESEVSTNAKQRLQRKIKAVIHAA